MKKALSFLTAILLIAIAAVPAMAMGTVSYVQLIHIKNGKSFDIQTSTMYTSLEEAVSNAVSGDIIEVFDNVTVSSPIMIPDGIELTVLSGTKREHDAIIGQSAFEYTDTNAATKTVKKGFDGTLFTVGKNSKVTFTNIVLDGNSESGTKGGLFYVESGAVLTLKKENFKSGVSLINSKLGNGSFGGAVYAEKDSAVRVENAAFNSNSASFGNDIYAEQKKDITIASGITANIAFGNAVEQIRGDVNGDESLSSADAIYLLRSIMRPSKYPISQNGDMDGDSATNTYDAIYLLRHIMRPSKYPLSEK